MMRFHHYFCGGANARFVDAAATIGSAARPCTGATGGARTVGESPRLIVAGQLNPQLQMLALTTHYLIRRLSLEVSCPTGLHL